jgi:hypothetical protein
MTLDIQKMILLVSILHRLLFFSFAKSSYYYFINHNHYDKIDNKDQLMPSENEKTSSYSLEMAAYKSAVVFIAAESSWNQLQHCIQKTGLF